MAVEGFGAPMFPQLFTDKIKHFSNEMQMWGMSSEFFSWLFLAKQGTLGQKINKDTLSVYVGRKKRVYEKVWEKKSVVAGYQSESWPVTTGLTQYELVTYNESFFLIPLDSHRVYIFVSKAKWKYESFTDLWASQPLCKAKFSSLLSIAEILGRHDKVFLLPLLELCHGCLNVSLF